MGSSLVNALLAIFALLVAHQPVQSSALSLVPPAMNVIRKYDNTFTISENNVMSQLQVINNAQYSLQQNMMNQISKEIEVMADSESKFVHNTWSFKISHNYATLDYILVIVDINDNRQARITGGVVRLSQHVPQQYNSEQRCARTGSRRYGFCGPRDMECHWHQVARGLHEHEINEVVTQLNNHLPAAQKMLA
jgi:hypothetical protein